MKPTYSLQSLRSSKARFAAKLSSKWLRRGLVAAIIISLLATLAVVIGLHDAAGWWWLCLAWPALVLLAWWDYELKKLPANKNPQTIDDVLAGGLLGRLPKNASPKQLAEQIMLSPGGHFYLARFGIGPNFLSHLVSDNPADTEAVWKEAISLQANAKVSTISSAAVAAALIRTSPQADQLLAHLQIDRDDIVSGVDWFEHVNDLIAQFQARRVKGGFGRDWSFGYIPTLSRFGLNISEQVERGGLLVRSIEGHQAVLDQMVETFGSGGRQNVALVGPLGVGKTTLVYAFAEKLLNPDTKLPNSLNYRQVISLDPGTLISHAHGRGELEGLVNELLYEAHSAKNIILCLDNAELFFEEGVGSVDLSNLLLPILEGGGVRMILTMDEQRMLQIGQRNPGLARTLNRIIVAPPERRDTLHILQDQLIGLEFQNKVTFMYQALTEAYRLGQRYVYEQAMPGKALKLLESAARYHENGLVTAHSVQQAIEQTLGVKVAVANNATERETLLNLEDLIHKRMINQTRAVKVVSDALRRARAGVRNPDRPIGTFLFLGPTGVGKTELAKSIGAVYFGGEDRLVRLDMNEYVAANDVSRLISDGANDPHSLTAQIAKQPFSVVLLDEIEKAHPNVLNTLLQLLDEGILRDINNREVNFRDAIIIATSNAGADKIREHIQKGEQLEQFEEEFTNELIESQQFRPEFLNRFDEIVLFRPLKEDELLQIVDLIITSINKNLALQKVSVEIDEEAKKLLVKTGNDPRLGARPMRRIVQRTVENLVARQMLGGQVAPGSVIHITLEEVQSALAK